MSRICQNPKSRIWLNNMPTIVAKKYLELRQSNFLQLSLIFLTLSLLSSHHSLDSLLTSVWPKESLQTVAKFLLAEGSFRLNQSICWSSQSPIYFFPQKEKPLLEINFHLFSGNLCVRSVGTHIQRVGGRRSHFRF